MITFKKNLPRKEKSLSEKIVITKSKCRYNYFLTIPLYKMPAKQDAKNKWDVE